MILLAENISSPRQSCPWSWQPVSCQPCQVAELLLGWARLRAAGRKPRNSSSPVLALGIQEFRTKGRFWLELRVGRVALGGAVRRGDLGQDLLHCLLPAAAPGGAARPCVHPLPQNSVFYSMHSTWQPEMRD